MSLLPWLCWLCRCFLRLGVPGVRDEVLQRKIRKAEKWTAARNAKERSRFLHLGFNVLLVIRQRAVNVRRAAAYYRHFQLKRLFQGIRFAVKEERYVWALLQSQPVVVCVCVGWGIIAVDRH